MVLRVVGGGDSVAGAERWKDGGSADGGRGAVADREVRHYADTVPTGRTSQARTASIRVSIAVFVGETVRSPRAA
jgi:hypothetical protein